MKAALILFWLWSRKMAFVSQCGAGAIGSACLHAEQGWEVVAVEKVSMRRGLRKCVCGGLEGGGRPVCEVEEPEAGQALIWRSRRQHCTQVR